MVPGEVPDRDYDSVDVEPDEVIRRHIKLTHRTELVLMALKLAGIPFSRLTCEALDKASETMNNVCDVYDPELQD